MITSLDTLVTQQGSIRPSMVNMAKCPGCLICKGDTQQPSLIVNAVMDLVMRRSGVRFPEAALRSFGRRTSLCQHGAARAERASGSAFPGGPALHRRRPRRSRTAPRPQTVAELDKADQYIPGLTAEPAWPTLRAHLLNLAAETGKHPLRHLLTAASGRDLRTAGDMAAALYWRLPALTPTDPGPLPWLPDIPERSMPIRSAGVLGTAIPACRRPRRPGSRSPLSR
jgi:hypothetical protein